MIFNLTQKAIDATKSQIDKREVKPIGIRIGLRAGGCNGLSYVFEWCDKEPNEKDHIFIFDGVKILIDPKSAIYLDGTELDYETGMFGHGFKFNSPKQTGSCGCGASVVFDKGK